MPRRRRSRAAAPRPPAPTAVSPARRWWPWALLVALVLAVYAPVLRFDFVNWDDQMHVYENPQVLEPAGIARSWYERGKPGPYPVLVATYWTEWRAARGRPWLFHLDDVLLHAGNALLVGMLAAA